MATLKQVEAATGALGLTWAQIVQLCAHDLREHGVLTEQTVRNLATPLAYRVGDLVAMRGHRRYRAARVWKIGRRTRRVSAMYLTPSAVAESPRYGPSACNITGIPAGLITPATTP
jgi:hypothetical protein